MAQGIKGTGPPPSGLKPGRRRGSLAIKKAQDVLRGIYASGKKLPLDIMLQYMQEADEAGDRGTALDCAKAAAPYVHNRLNAITLDATKDLDTPGRDLLEMARLLRFLGAQPPAPGAPALAYNPALPILDAQSAGPTQQK